MGWQASSGIGNLRVKVARALGKARRGATGALFFAERRTPGVGLQADARVIYSSLAVLRFFTFALGAGLTFFWNTGPASPLPAAPLVALAGLYSVGRVLPSPFLRWRIPVVETATLLGEIPLNLVLVVATGGLDSPFILYSLLPALTAGSTLDMRTAVAVAAATILPILGAHVAPAGLTRLPSLLMGNYLAFALLYGVSAFVLSITPFLANVNLRRRITSLAAEQERERLRREVHDGTAQTIAFMRMMLHRARESQSGLSADRLEDVIAAMERSHVAVRDYLDGAEDMLLLRPLGVSLRTMTSEVSQATGLPVTMRVSGQERALPHPVNHQLLKMAREALTNAAKHAFPSSISISLEWGPTEVTLRVRDDGRGFSVAQSSGLGMSTMRHRAQLIGASLTVSSLPGQGTQVVMVYPFGNREAVR